MVALLALLFLVVPIAELAVLIKVAGVVGIGWTILLLIGVGVVGGWLVKREGLSVVNRVRTALQRGELPHRDVVDGFLILFAGALMLTPGFLTDVLGLVLLFPPTRLAVRAAVMRRFRDRVQVYEVGGRDITR